MPAIDTQLMAEIAIKAENQVTKQIFPFWNRAVINPAGGLFGAVSVDGRADATAEQGVLLYSRALWSYSVAAITLKNDDYLNKAHQLYNSLLTYFFDTADGGVYWSVSANHQPCDSRKHLLAHTYSLFALAKYYEASHDNVALDHAQTLNSLIQQHFKRADGSYCGLLSDKFQLIEGHEENFFNGTCNQLHTLEAMTQFYSANPTAPVKTQIEQSLDLFATEIFNHNGHLPLLFNRQWQPVAAEVSIGHNLEAPWLCCLACLVIGDETRLKQMRTQLVRLIDISFHHGLHSSGNILFGLDRSGQPPEVMYWWPQTEAICALYCAAQLTGEAAYTQQLAKVWSNIENHWVDNDNGEWFSQLNMNLEPVLSANKAGEWRSIYHIIRACSLLTGGLSAIAKVQKIKMASSTHQ
jgi:mannobiose 2-epimerase